MDRGEEEEVEEVIDDVPDEEKLAIAHHMLVACPPGQLAPQLADLRILLGAELLNSERAAVIARAHNASVGRVAMREPGSARFVLAKEGEREQGLYLDPSTNELLQIDPYSAKMVDGSSPEPATEVEATAETRRQSLESELHRYRRSSFSPGVSASSVFATEKEGGACTLVAYVSCEHVNLRNWWSGSWMGRYEVAYDDGSAKIRVSGTVKVRAHYFESGNMQLETSQDVPPTCIGSDEGAAGIMSVIKTSEDSLHQQLEEMYANMGDSLKAARRARPIKADKFAWNIHQVRMVKNLVKP